MNNKLMKFTILTVIVLFFSLVTIGYVSVRYILFSDHSPSEKPDADVKIISSDGIKLYATETIVSDGHKWAIFVHSYRTSRSFTDPYAREYQLRGYNTLQPDNRAHGISEGKYIGMGYLDQFDILCWINYIIERDPDAEVVLHGVSMGGSTLMILSGQEQIPENVTVIIEDCGYSSAREYLTLKLRQRFSLPSFPIIPIANVSFKVMAGYWMDDASAMEGVMNSNIPTLFIHGTDDETVSVEDAYRLYYAATCPKQLYVVEGAGHGEALMQDETMYWDKVFGFIEKHKKND
ncbi:MAG: alpha/beta hydrolase [Lachnospiraceae bacterium]|nr:alpha/beta hydrolase [Lachnospiraceae bacterium]